MKTAMKLLFGAGTVARAFADRFPRADGALGNGWQSTTWAVSSNRAANVPVGTEILTNGDFSAWAGSPSRPTGWTVSGATEPDPSLSQVAVGEAHGGAGTGACNLYSSATAYSPGLFRNILSASKWYRFALTINPLTAGNLGVIETGTSLGKSYTTGGAKAFVLRTTTAGQLRIMPNSTITDITVDDASILDLSTPTLFATRPLYQYANVSGLIYAGVDEPCGFVLYVDASNYVVAYLDRLALKLRLDQCLAGTITSLDSSVSLTYADGALLQVNRASGANTLSMDWNYGTTTIAATALNAAFANATTWGLFAPGTLSRIDDFLAVDLAHPQASFFAYGDSKVLTASGGIWVEHLVHDASLAGPRAVVQSPAKNGVSGSTVAIRQGTIDSDLSGLTGTPTHILSNLGANDAASLPAEATWKANYLYILDAMHTKWPGATIYVTRPWRRNYGANCNTLAGWIADIVAARTSFLRLGDDERVWLEGGDDGATNTSDGTHYSAAGVLVAATQRQAIMGWS